MVLADRRRQGAKKVPEMRQLGVPRFATREEMKGELRHADRSGAALVNDVS